MKAGIYSKICGVAHNAETQLRNSWLNCVHAHLTLRVSGSPPSRPPFFFTHAGSMSQFEEFMAMRKREAGEQLQRAAVEAVGKGASGQNEVLQRVLEAAAVQPLTPSEAQRKQRYPVILLLLMLEAFACMYTVMFSDLSSILDGVYVGKTYVVPVASALFRAAHHFGHVAVFVFIVELLVDLFEQRKQHRVGSVWRWADAALELAAAWIWLSTWSDRTYHAHTVSTPKQQGTLNCPIKHAHLHTQNCPSLQLYAWLCSAG